jgi:glycosyltransferase involved in cell wall biosynthesis
MSRAVFGLPMYRSEALVGDVIESLLEQDFDDLAIVALDDGSDDGTIAVARRYAARDPRLTVEANPMRRGMIRTWNRVLERAYELHPEFEYFAFASDNDLRESSWLSALVDKLERHPSAVLAYSRFGVIRNGQRIPFPERWRLDTRSIADPLQRLRTLEGMPAGAMMYGLHRRSTLEAAGRVPPVLFSDILFLTHLALFGEFVQHPEVLWYRSERRTGARVRRQRTALFGPHPPLTSYLPVSVQHAGWLAERLVVGRRRPDGIDRAEGAAIAGHYLARWVTRIDLEPRAAPLRRRLGIETKRLQRRRKDMRKTARAFRRALRAAVRGAVLAAPAGERAYRRLRNRS